MRASKSYSNIPFAHRLHSHTGHCRFVHGHNWKVTFHFEAEQLDANGFVIDFGKLGLLKQWMSDHLDHRLVLQADDPALDLFRQYDGGLWLLTILPNGVVGSTEGLAEYLKNKANALAKAITAGRTICVGCHLEEGEQNGADA